MIAALIAALIAAVQTSAAKDSWVAKQKDNDAELEAAALAYESALGGSVVDQSWKDFRANCTKWLKFRDAHEAATGSSEIASNTTEIATPADASAHVLGQMGDSVSELARLPADLRTRVETFTC